VDAKSSDGETKALTGGVAGEQNVNVSSSAAVAAESADVVVMAVVVVVVVVGGEVSTSAALHSPSFCLFSSIIITNNDAHTNLLETHQKSISAGFLINKICKLDT